MSDCEPGKIVQRGLIVVAAYYAGSFFLAYLITRLFIDSPCRVAYGMICAWWAALYISSVIEIKAKDLLLLAIVGFPIAAFLALKRHDMEYSIYGNIVLFIFLMTPALVNLLVGLIKKRWMSRRVG